MKNFLPLLKLLLRFVLLYIALIFIYQLYLNHFEGLGQDDPFTCHIAEQCQTLQNKWGYTTYLEKKDRLDGMLFIVNNQMATRMIEGCNAVSIMIMFVAFIFAFYKGFLKTISYILASLILLYILNVLRIVLINIIAVQYPSYLKASHDYLFPAIIYGGVVVLWIVWINFFVLKEEKNV